MRDETVIVRPGDTVIYPVIGGMYDDETAALSAHLTREMPGVRVGVVSGGNAVLVYRPDPEPDRAPGPLTVDLAAQRAFEARAAGLTRNVSWHKLDDETKASWRKVALAVLQGDA